MTTEEKVLNLLKAQRKTISLAESCTGGLLASRLTDISGSSKSFLLGVVAYSNTAKENLLNVPPGLLKKHGAVSEEVAMAMAAGARKRAHSDFGIGITGIAGPGGGRPSKPVGLVYIAVNAGLESLCLKCRFRGTRKQIKRRASTQALKILLEFLE